MSGAGADREFAFLTIREAARLLRARKVSSLELTNDALARIERLNPSLNAFITVTSELARKQARTADREIRAGKHRGPLHGIPITIKDNFNTRGVRTTAGSKILRDFVPDQDARAVARLRDAGAVFLGKTNLNEFAYGIHGLNPHYGDVHNPWSLDRITGGSSSGSSAALAAGIGFGSVGTDTGGSLRIPASFCGLVGFKPSFQLIQMDGIVPLADSLDHAGPLARTVDDAAIIFHATREAYKRWMRRGGKAQLQARPPKIKLAWPKNYFFDLVDPEVEAAIKAAVRVLESLGARTEEISLPHLEDSVEASTTIGLAEASHYHSRMGYFPARSAEYSDDVRRRLELGMEVTAVDFIKAMEIRGRLAAAFTRAFFKFDAIVAPATAIIAPRVGDHEIVIRGERTSLRDALINANRPANSTGDPAIALPCGFSKSGLPIGLQLIGPRWQEPKLLAIARAYEQVTDWHKRHPTL